MNARVSVLNAVVMIGLCAGPAIAGPPYITDDPVPTDTGHWEIFTFTDNTFDKDGTATEAGFDINYGPMGDVQLTATLALDHESSADDTELADTEIGVKYRLINDQRHGSQFALFPKVILPTAPGSDRAAFQIPVWAQQDFGRWSLFGGGGVTIQRDAGTQDFWEEGIALVNEPRDGLAFGAEVAHAGAEEDGGTGSTTVDVAANVHVAGPLSLVAAVGPEIEDESGHTATRGYFGLLTNF